MDCVQSDFTYGYVVHEIVYNLCIYLILFVLHRETIITYRDKTSVVNGRKSRGSYLIFPKGKITKSVMYFVFTFWLITAVEKHILLLCGLYSN